jgi:hypothetical protein
MQVVEQSRTTLALRTDDRKQRVIVETDAGNFFGREVADRAALDALAARLEQAAVAVMRGNCAPTEQRRPEHSECLIITPL